MNNSINLLSDITVFNKYARYLPVLERREDWAEIVGRNCDMHVKRYPELAEDIQRVFRDFVITKKVLPSMRSLQFGGRPIELANNRIFNCAYMPTDHPDAFSEMMFLLLGGTGGGYSVQRQHVAKLPTVQGTNDTPRRFVIGDSIEGWADSVKVLIEAYFYGKARPVFIFDDIREKGAPLITSGGKAPGPEPLRVCLEALEGVLLGAAGRDLKPIEAHDMMCIIADAVLAGGIRRAALICLFSRDDKEMLTCKTGAWWETAPWRGRANNSAVLPRGQVSREEFDHIWRIVEMSGAGEPGVYWTSDEDWGTNPCCEIALRPFQFCNLTEVNTSDVKDQQDFNERAEAAAFIGTLQAGYTDFHYLRPVWRETTEKDALVGVGLTGIASGAILGLDLSDAAECAKHMNEFTANRIGINQAARVTTVKPAGTTSLVVGSSSGIHAWHAAHYIRRMRVGKNEALYRYMAEKAPALVEDDQFNPQGAVLSFPQKAPDGAIMRTESSADLLERVKRFNLEWVRAGHRDGVNTHNVSCTISLKAEEWEPTGEWMWANRNDYNGIAALPFDGGTYPQAPFEDCTAEEYAELLPHLEGLNMHDVKEDHDETDLSGEVACSGGLCELV
jgi:ribonucleoside-diphosphate reductase alpha chain